MHCSWPHPLLFPHAFHWKTLHRECISVTLSDGCCPECGLPGWVKDLSPNYQLAGLISHLNSLKDLLGCSSPSSLLRVSSSSTQGELHSLYQRSWLLLSWCSAVVCLKAGSQYDAGGSIASRASPIFDSLIGWTRCSLMLLDLFKVWPPTRCWRQRHIVNQALSLLSYRNRMVFFVCDVVQLPPAFESTQQCLCIYTWLGQTQGFI